MTAGITQWRRSVSEGTCGTAAGQQVTGTEVLCSSLSLRGVEGGVKGKGVRCSAVLN